MRWPQLHTKDIIAAIVLTACFILIANGINSTVSIITTMVVTFYFGDRVRNDKKG